MPTHIPVLLNETIENLKEIYEQRFSYPIDGILLDLGISSLQL